MHTEYLGLGVRIDSDCRHYDCKVVGGFFFFDKWRDREQESGRGTWLGLFRTYENLLTWLTWHVAKFFSNLPTRLTQ